MASVRPSLRVPYKTVDDLEIPSDIYLPSIFSSKLCPVLIMIHGGAFMLGHSGMNNKDQISDCLDRGWIVLGIEHRLCPGVNVLEGPMTDTRDSLKWVQDGGLSRALQKEGLDRVQVDGERVMVMGTSSGGHLALCTAWDVPKPPLGILDFYGAKHFSDSFWSQRMAQMPDHFFQPRPRDEVEALMKERTAFIGGMSLEGQSLSPTLSDSEARQAFAMHQIATGNVINTIWPYAPQGFEKVDPMMNISDRWPPIAIVHGTADSMIPMRLSKELQGRLQDNEVEVAFFEVEGEGHTFCGKMKRGSRTWDMQRKGFDFLKRVIERSYQK
ncbi:Nn.00g091950.m01.CDS01 [Neocucurbitaria sp. VM-36]